MPFNRPTLSELRQRNQSYIQSELKTGGNLLRFSNIGVISDADAGMAHLHYGYLDYIARQATPYNATDEYLAAWGALKDVFRKAANPATSNEVRFSGIAGRVIPAGRLLNRADGTSISLIKKSLLPSRAVRSVKLPLSCPARWTMQLAAAIGVTARRERY